MLRCQIMVAIVFSWSKSSYSIIAVNLCQLLLVILEDHLDTILVCTQPLCFPFVIAIVFPWFKSSYSIIVASLCQLLLVILEDHLDTLSWKIWALSTTWSLICCTSTSWLILLWRGFGSMSCSYKNFITGDPKEAGKMTSVP